VPLLVLVALLDVFLSSTLNGFWVSLFPFFAEPSSFALGSALASPDVQATIVGAWGLLGLSVVNAVFNAFLGEELLFRGVLLPRMAGVFGKWDWVANGILMGVYHLHQPWGILTNTVGSVFLLSLPISGSDARGLRSSPIPGRACTSSSCYWASCWDWGRATVAGLLRAVSGTASPFRSRSSLNLDPQGRHLRGSQPGRWSNLDLTIGV
jgi:hypothetical protein